MSVHDLPSVNAFLNALSALLLIWGYTFIRRRLVDQHRRVMLTAFAVSCLFLVCYLIYHFQVGSVHYPHTGILRPIYFTILITHTLLAAAVPVLAIITLNRGLKARYTAHRAIARWTLPIWLYVNVTGVIVYLMLYRF
jgi:uncharacterized membrane protein YozB (DUF420 family)